VTLVLGGFCAVQTFAGTYVGGIENSEPGSTYEGIGDYNDMIFSLTATGLTLVSNDGGTWSALSGVTLYPTQGALNATAGSSVANPFWNNSSEDGTAVNIGYCLTTSNCNGMGTPAYNQSSTPAVNQFLSISGAPDNNFYFTFTSGTATSVVLGAIADGLSTSESLGWYDPFDQSQNGGITSGVAFTPTATFGLYFTIPGTGFVTQNSLDNGAGAGTTQSRFAIFQQVTPNGVPEPGTMALFGIGALALGLIPRLRKRS
jgi:hypothetical protein